MMKPTGNCSLPGVWATVRRNLANGWQIFVSRSAWASQFALRPGGRLEPLAGQTGQVIRQTPAPFLSHGLLATSPPLPFLISLFSLVLSPPSSLPHALALCLILNILRRPLERVSKSPWQQKDCEKKKDRGREP